MLSGARCIFDNFYGLPAEPGRSLLQNGSQWTFTPVMETAWGDSRLNLRAILPGVAQQDLKVSVQNNQLILEGERKTPEAFKNHAQAQLAYGKFCAAVTLPSGLNVDKLSCRLQDGILDIQNSGIGTNEEAIAVHPSGREISHLFSPCHGGQPIPSHWSYFGK